MSIPTALLVEAEAQKGGRIDYYLRQAELERQAPAIADGVALRFAKGHPRWAGVVALVQSRGRYSIEPESVLLEPDGRHWRIHVNYPLGSDTNSWEGPVAESSVFACFNGENRHADGP